MDNGTSFNIHEVDFTVPWHECDVNFEGTAIAGLRPSTSVRYFESLGAEPGKTRYFRSTQNCFEEECFFKTFVNANTLTDFLQINDNVVVTLQGYEEDGVDDNVAWTVGRIAYDSIDDDGLLTADVIAATLEDVVYSAFLADMNDDVRLFFFLALLLDLFFP